LESEQTTRKSPPSNVAVLGAFYEAFNRWDLDAVVEFLRQDFEWRPAFGRGLMGTNAYVGRDGFRRYCADVLEDFSEYRVDVLTIEAVGRDNVLAAVRAAAVGRTSGVEVDRPFFMLYTFDAGLLVRGETFQERAEALRAAVGV
jgi:ketosteroid isomerase-like protein